MTSCPARGSCKTEAPGWLNGVHPKPEDGLVRRTVCFHYDGDCCYESLDIYVMNCPGMFVYKLKNLPFTLFSARYCFEHDAQGKKNFYYLLAPTQEQTVIIHDDVLLQCMIIAARMLCECLLTSSIENLAKHSGLFNCSIPHVLNERGSGFNVRR